MACSCWWCCNEIEVRLPERADAESYRKTQEFIVALVDRSDGGASWAVVNSGWMVNAGTLDIELVNAVAAFALAAHCVAATGAALRLLGVADGHRCAGSRALAGVIKQQALPWPAVARDLAAFPAVLVRTAVFLCLAPAFDGAAKGRQLRPLLTEVRGGRTHLREAREALACAKAFRGVCAVEEELKELEALP